MIIFKHKTEGEAPAVKKTNTRSFAAWDAVKEEYFERILAGKPASFIELSKKYKVGLQTLRNKSSKEQWPRQVTARQKKNDEILSNKLIERTTLVLDILNEEFATNEAEIRKRHAILAREIQGRAIARIRKLYLSEFSSTNAIQMLKLGLEEERKAMGMADVYIGTKESPQHPEYQPIVEQMGGHKRVQEVGMLLLKALKESPPTDIESEPQSEED